MTPNMELEGVCLAMEPLRKFPGEAGVGGIGIPALRSSRMALPGWWQ